MKPTTRTLLAAFLAFGAAISASAADKMTITAKRLAVDNVTKAAMATGSVVAVSGDFRLRGDYMYRDEDGKAVFSDPTCATTCSNEVGHTHWNVTGELEYRENDYVILRNAWLKFYEIPIFWMPYLYYPLDNDCGFSWMPGYIGRWGAFLLTKYEYHVIGDTDHQDNTWWLSGDTRFDLRYEQGVAFGEDLKWNLGDFGAGSFNFYYAWDQDAEDHYGVGSSGWNSANWGSAVEEQRYLISGRHKWEPTERDVVRIRGSYYSDSYFRTDFMRKTFFDLKTQWLTYDNSGVFWEHLEESYSAGIEASGRLNEFYGMTGRLPELYFDVNPMPVFGSPVNYETQNRLGYLTRDPAEYGAGADSVYGTNPGVWASYDAFRFDTYHRLTAPFRTCDDLLSVVPRIGYHGTYWSESGYASLDGTSQAGEAGSAFRSIGEAGVTFATRGSGWVNDVWSHMTEPYLDVLAQKSWLNGCGNSNRPYVFDNLDSSMTWEDQFAGRGRNLPYSYCGLTPGWRNAWSKLDESGQLREIFDLDVYMAAQFNTASYLDASDGHRLAEIESPNYGRNGAVFVPGARVRWNPAEDMSFGLRGEYDSDNNRIPLASATWVHRLSKKFKYSATYYLRDHRYWDFSSTPDTENQNTGEVCDDLNFARYHMANIGFEHQIFDWLAWGPHLRWDLRENELDAVGTWVDYLTDCLGFRVILEYDNEYTTLDGYRHDSEWSIGFYIYLRAFGADSGSVFFGQ